MEPENLISWFHTLAEDLRQSGTPAEITSGLACIHYNLAEITKDCDIWIPPASLGTFKEIVAQRTWRSTHAVHRSRLSAPLDPRWLDGGWSSHIIWPGPPQAQIDIFGRLPRVTTHTGTGIFSNEETLARVKMTQRDKDWSTVHLLGERLLAKKNPEGLLFLRTAESLLQARKRTANETWDAQTAIRPLLASLNNAPGLPLLDACLRIEKAFWQRVDNLRIEQYQKAVKEYAKASAEILRTKTHLVEQDAALTRLAENTLPQRPLQDTAEQIIAMAEEQTLVAVDQTQFNVLWLPTDWAKTTLESCYAPPEIAKDPTQHRTCPR